MKFPHFVIIIPNRYSSPKGDLAVMSIEAYENLVGKFELYGLIQEGLTDIAEGKTRPFSEAMSDIRSRRKR